MASEAQKQQLKQKVTQLVDQRYGGDWDRAFNHYAALSGAGSQVERDDLLPMLEDAGIGNFITRGKWADGIIAELDSNNDKKISSQEFRTALDADAVKLG